MNQHQRTARDGHPVERPRQSSDTSVVVDDKEGSGLTVTPPCLGARVCAALHGMWHRVHATFAPSDSIEE